MSNSKNLQIDISTLSEQQKRFYVQLLAKSNLQFQKKDNKFVTQFKVSSSNITSLKNDNKIQEKTQKKIQPKKKQDGKKLLQKTVKIGDLTKLQNYYKHIQIYVYPKRISHHLLCQIIESIYELFWQQNKSKSQVIKKISFTQWFHNLITHTIKQKIKIQQFIVNLIDTLNHYRPKYKGVEVFYNFLSQKYNIDALFYFLVLRGILEQVTKQKIVQKSTHILGYRIKNNPQFRQLSEDQVIKFIGNLFEGQLQKKQRIKPIQSIFQGLTSYMYFDDSKRKNYINYYQLIIHLLTQFIQTDISSCDMSISNTQIQIFQQSLSQLITDQPSQNQIKKNKNEFYDKYSIILDQQNQQLSQQRNYFQQQFNYKTKLKQKIYQKINIIWNKLNIQMSQQLKQIIQNICQAITTLDKSIWLRFRGGQLNDSQLYAIQRLQKLYKQGQNKQLSVMKLSRDILLLPLVRQQLTKVIKI